MPPLNLIDALPKFGGFNRLEKEEYYRLLLKGTDDTVNLLTIAAEIAVAKGWTQEEAITKLQNMGSGKAEDVLALSDQLPLIMQYEEGKKVAELMSGFKLARLMLLSRLPVAWMQAQSEQLAQYGIEIDYETLGKIPRKDWLTDLNRQDAIDQILDLLPEQFIHPIEDFAQSELHEGRTDSSVVEERNESPLPVPSDSPQKPVTPTTKNGNSGISAISESKRPASQTLATTGKKSI